MKFDYSVSYFLTTQTKMVKLDTVGLQNEAKQILGTITNIPMDALRFITLDPDRQKDTLVLRKQPTIIIQPTFYVSEAVKITRGMRVS